MKKITIIFMCVLCCAGVASAKSGTLLDLFYGMESDDDVHYHDSRIDNIPGLMHRELVGTWYKSADSWKFTMTIGIYLDESFPTDAVKTTILSKANKLIKSGFAIGDTDERDEDWCLDVNIDVQPAKFLDRWESRFNAELAAEYMLDDTTKCEPILGARACTVAHKVYENSKVATYIVAFSYNAHGGCGCPSYSDYYTVDKATGKILSISDIISKVPRKTLTYSLYNQYARGAKKAGFQPNDAHKGDNMISKASGAAIINEGILVYYKPYTIGCGAEGQYNLIIK